MTAPVQRTLGWVGIVRLGLVQTALGAIVVLTNSTLNRIMVVELALPAMLPGLLVGLHYAVQALRPRWGHGSDVGGRLTPWIVGGMAVLAAGGVCAAAATASMSADRMFGIAFAFFAYLMIGMGVGAAGTSLLVLLARQVEAKQRAPAATIVWIMMIAGFAITAATAGHFLDPFSMPRLVAVTAAVSGAAFLVACLAVWNVEWHAPNDFLQQGARSKSRPAFSDALAEVWRDARARRFAIFIFVSMLAYSAQELILEPFAGAVFAMSPGQSAKLSGLQHSGVVAGMIFVALAGRSKGGFSDIGITRLWTSGGCVASALALCVIVAGSRIGAGWPIRESIFALGVANGIFAASAIGAMMALACEGGTARQGVRMGLWGAAQGLAFGLGGLMGATAADLARHLLGSPVAAYSIVFSGEALLFVAAALIALRVHRAQAETAPNPGAQGDYAVQLSRG